MIRGTMLVGARDWGRMGGWEVTANGDGVMDRPKN